MNQQTRFGGAGSRLDQLGTILGTTIDPGISSGIQQYPAYCWKPPGHPWYKWSNNTYWSTSDYYNNHNMFMYLVNVGSDQYYKASATPPLLCQ